MPTRAEFLAREIARRAGYDPDRLVIELDRKRDFDYHAIGVAPVEIGKLRPLYTRFEREAREILKRELVDG